MTRGKTRAATAAKLKENKNKKPENLQPKRLDFSTPNNTSNNTNPTPSTSSAAIPAKKSTSKTTAAATTNISATNPSLEIQEDNEMARVPFPLFKTDDIESWFRRVEHWFTFGKVASEKDKFALIASQIEHPTVANLNEMLNPHAETPYTNLKKKIVSIFEKSTTSKINQLLSGCQLGDMKPSQLLAEMKRMGGNVGDEILRNLWAKRLPLHVQSVVAAATTSSLDEVSLIADAVIDVVGASSSSSVNQVTNNNNPPSKINEIDELRTSIELLTKSFRDFQSDRSRSKSRDHQSSRDRSNSSYKPPENRMCRYHRKFGDKAFMCTKPCSFVAETGSKN